MRPFILEKADLLPFSNRLEEALHVLQDGFGYGPLCFCFVLFTERGELYNLAVRGTCLLYFM